MKTKDLCKLLLVGLIIISALFTLTCSDLFSNPEDAPKSVTWIEIKTGLTDSFALDDDEIDVYQDSFATYKEFTNFIGSIIDSGGFDITWNGVRNADYYEIRISKSRITESNWDNATLVKTVEAKPTSRMFTSIKVLQPKIKGNNCTGCEYCVAACPNNAITMFRGKAVIDLSLCTGCGRCYDTCNFDAVSDCFMGEAYYFAVRSFSGNNEGSLKVKCTKKAYLLRYTCWHYREPTRAGEAKKQICGACAEGCYILTTPTVEKGCPVDAILYHKRTTAAGDSGMVYIDQSKCIYCGNCVTKCMLNSCGEVGNAAIRREVVAVE